MGRSWKNGGYSSRVELYVIINDERIPVSQVGPDSFVLREPRPIQPGYARLVISIDGQEKEHDIILGASDPTATEIAYG